MTTSLVIEEGGVVKNGEIIATHDPKKNTVTSKLPLDNRDKTAITKQLKKKPKYIVESQAESEEGPAASPTPPIAAPVVTTSGQATDTATVNPGAKATPPEPPKVKAPKPAPVEQEDKGPEKDITMGDKTPAYMDWYRETKGEEAFIAKYGSRYHKDNPKNAPEPPNPHGNLAGKDVA